MTRSLEAFLVLSLILFTVINMASAASPDNLLSASSNSILPSIDLLNSRSNEVAGSDLADNEKNVLADLYRKSISNLKLAAKHRQKLEAYTLVIQNGADENSRLKAELKQAEEKTEASGFAAKDIPLSEVEQELPRLKADLTLAETKFNELDNELNREKNRPNKIRQRLTEVKRLLSELSLLPKQPINKNQSVELIEARDWVNNTLQEQLRTEGLMLEQELSSQPIRLELLTTKRDLAEINLVNLKKRAEGLEKVANQIRLDEAEIAKSEAMEAERDAASKHPVVAQLASLNTNLSEEIDRLANEIEVINQDEVEASISAKQIEESFNTTRQKLEIAGLSQVLGQVLLQEKRALPDTGHFQKLAKSRERKIADTLLSQIQLEEERRKLRDTISYAASLATAVSDEQRPGVIAELQSLANSRKALIDSGLNVQRVYLQTLGELDISQRRLEDSVESYTEFLNKRLLWIRSTEQVGLETIRGIPRQIAQLFAPERWQFVLQKPMRDVFLAPLPGLALIFFLSILLMRQKLVNKIQKTGINIGNLRLDKLTDTLRAIGLIILLALPIPALMFAIGREMISSFEAADFSRSIGKTLIILAPMLFHLSAFRLFLAPNSVAQVHFGWQTVGLQQLHYNLGWFTPLAFALAFVSTLAYQDPTLGSGSGMGRAAFIALMTTFAVFFYRLAKPRGGTLAKLTSGDETNILIRFRHLWFAIFVGPPIASIVVSLAGYMYTAGTLIERILQSAWFALLVIVIHQFILRWLTLNQRRLRLEAARAKRLAKQEARATTEIEEESEGLYLREIEEPQVDFGALNTNSKKLLNNTLIVVGLLGLWGIWSDILPALKILNDITLWSYTRSGDNEIIPITLSSLILALFVIIVTIIATRQLPAFLEIILLQRLKMSQGSRYTVTTLTRYTIIAVGIAWVFGFLGGSWSEIQWIFAALGVGIGFGLQEIVANFISGLIILFERPIRVGDVVTVGNTDGVVTRIQIRATTIRNFDRKELLVPNKNFITQELLNWSLSDQTTRIMIQVGIAYGSDAERALLIMEEVANEHHRVMKDPAPFTVFESFGDNALLLSLRCYIDDIDHRLRTITELNLAINQRMNEAGIEIAFPQRDIHLDTRQPLDIRLHREHSDAPTFVTTSAKSTDNQ